VRPNFLTNFNNLAIKSAHQADDREDISGASGQCRWLTRSKKRWRGDARFVGSKLGGVVRVADKAEPQAPARSIKLKDLLRLIIANSSKSTTEYVTHDAQRNPPLYD